MRFVRRETSLSPPVKYFYWPFQGGAFLWIICYFCLVFVMLSCASVYWCLVVTCWERSDLMALVCDVLLWKCHFPILVQIWCLIVSIPDLCPPSYFNKANYHWSKMLWLTTSGTTYIEPHKCTLKFCVNSSPVTCRWGCKRNMSVN